MNTRLVIMFFSIMLTVNLHADVLFTEITSLSKNSYDIIEGKVTKVKSRWDNDHISIFTYVYINLSKSYKNKILDKEITIKDIGRSLDGYTNLASCQAQYAIGEDVLVFLQKDEKYYRTYGLNQGKFKINILNGKKYLIRDINPKDLLIIKKETEIKNEYTYSELQSIIQQSFDN